MSHLALSLALGLIVLFVCIKFAGVVLESRRHSPPPRPPVPAPSSGATHLTQ